MGRHSEENRRKVREIHASGKDQTVAFVQEAMKKRFPNLFDLDGWVDDVLRKEVTWGTISQYLELAEEAENLASDLRLMARDSAAIIEEHEGG